MPRSSISTRWAISAHITRITFISLITNLSWRSWWPLRSLEICYPFQESIFSYLEGLESLCSQQVQVLLRFLPVRQGQLLLECPGIHLLQEFLRGQIFLEFQVLLGDQGNPSDRLRHFPQILQALPDILPVLKRMFKMAILIYYIYRVHHEALFVHLGLSGRSTCDFCQFEHRSSCKPAVPESLAL